MSMSSIKFHFSLFYFITGFLYNNEKSANVSTSFNGFGEDLMQTNIKELSMIKFFASTFASWSS